MSRKTPKWCPPVETTPQEERILKLCKKRKLYAFFRQYRHLIFDDMVQEEMMEAYSDVGQGSEPKPPAQLALAMLMQAAFRVADHEVPTLTAVDRRWQMVLDCLGRDEPLMGQGTVFDFRMRAMASGLTRLLIEKTVRLARETKGFGAAALRTAFDSSPLAGAGRVEDTFNLIGHAALQVVRTAAQRLGKTPEQVAEAAGIPLAVASSIKAGLDLDWDERDARKRGIETLLGQVDALGRWLRSELNDALNEPPLKQQWETVERLVEQDTEPDPEGGGRRIIEGTTKDRQISVSDPDMRHGRKSRTKRIDGYKRSIALDLDVPGLVCATKVVAANQRDSEAAEALFERIEAQQMNVSELHADRAYPDAEAVQLRQDRGMRVLTKPHPVGNGGHFSKTDFCFDFDQQTVACPGGVVIDFRLDTNLEFPASKCDPCKLRAQCTSARQGQGRRLKVHRREPFQAELRARSKTADGRAERRERVAVEHGLAHIGQTQGTKARFKGLEKNEFDLERHAVVNNCYVLARLWRDEEERLAA